MKLRTLFLGLLITSFALWGCDVITNPIKPTQVNSSLPNTPPTYKDSSITYTTYKTLVEDYMGHTCSNCPPAVTEGETLLTLYPGQVVIMEVNYGQYADADTLDANGPCAAPPADAFNKDYTSVVGNYWGSQKVFNVNVWPWGIINGVGYPNTNIRYTNWPDSVQKQIAANPTASVTINIHDSCWVPQRIIGVKFKVTFQKALSSTANYSLETVIVEDSIVDWQEDGNTSPCGFDTNFVHHNVLRGAFGNNNGGLTSGIAIPQDSSRAKNATWTSYQTYDFIKGENGKAAGWNMTNCYIIAFVYNQTTYQVVQSEMIKVE